MAGLPGRKALLYVSDGLPMVPGEDMYYALNQKFQNSSSITLSREFDSSRRFQELANVAATNQVVLYTIDAAGLAVVLGGSSRPVKGRCPVAIW